MAYDFQVVIDSVDPHTLADWWAEAIGWPVEPTDENFIQGLIDQGHASAEDTIRHRGALVWKVGAAIRHPDSPADGPPKRVLFQLVPETKTVKNRVHLDLWVGERDRESELERLTGLGATFLHRGSQGPFSWITLIDPEGNELCLS